MLMSNCSVSEVRSMYFNTDCEADTCNIDVQNATRGENVFKFNKGASHERSDVHSREPTRSVGVITNQTLFMLLRY